MIIHMVWVVSGYEYLIWCFYYDINYNMETVFKIITAISYQKPTIYTHISHKQVKLRDYIHSAAGSSIVSVIAIWCYCDDFTDDIVQWLEVHNEKLCF